MGNTYTSGTNNTSSRSDTSPVVKPSMGRALASPLTTAAFYQNHDIGMDDDLTVHISGTATIEIAGQVAQQSITIDGAGNFEAGDLGTSSTTVDINGLGNATVWATETLDISINGGGNLRYYGLPQITQDINGFSDIDNLGEK